MHIEINEDFKERAKIKVVGVGGAGGNAINRMVEAGYQGVEFIAINTDALALSNSKADQRIAIGKTTSKGLGAGAKPKVGFDAICENRKEVEEALRGADLIFITAGMGGGTGTGASPIVAQICREKNILCIGVVSRPFSFEGPVRAQNAQLGIAELQKHVDTMVIVDNTKLLKLIDKKASTKSAFQFADSVLVNAVKGVSDIILRYGDVQVDFSDLSTVLKDGGDALMCTGIAEGENRALEAAEKAIHSPLLDEGISIQGAGQILIHFSSGEDPGMLEIAEATEFIRGSAGDFDDTNIIFGTSIDPELGEKLSITVIATHFNQYDRNQSEQIETIDYTQQVPQFQNPNAFTQSAPQHAPRYDYQQAPTNTRHTGGMSAVQAQSNPFNDDRIQNFQNPHTASAPHGNGRITNRLEVKAIQAVEEEVMQPHQPTPQSHAPSMQKAPAMAHSSSAQMGYSSQTNSMPAAAAWQTAEVQNDWYKQPAASYQEDQLNSQYIHETSNNHLDQPTIERSVSEYKNEEEEDLDYPAFLRNQDY